MSGEETPNIKLNSIDEKILRVVKKAKHPLSKTKIAHKLNLSPATVSKYVDVLAKKGLLAVMRYDIIHLVSLGESNAT